MSVTAIQSKRIKQRKEFSKRVTAYIVLSVIGFTMFVPFLWMIATSLKDPGDVFTQPDVWWRYWIPEQLMWQNYVRAWQAVPFSKFYLNSVFVAICVTVGQIATCSFAAYAFGRLKFPGRDKIFFAYLATLMIPRAVMMIPVFALVSKIGWIDTYLALIVPALFEAYGTFMLRQFFMSLPSELEDAAKIDGCSLFGIYWKIILPLSKPAIAALSVFIFMGNWRSFVWPLLVINRTALKTLPIGLEYFKSQYTTDWTLLMAGAVMATIPLVIVFLFSQKFFIEGIKLSGMKG